MRFVAHLVRTDAVGAPVNSEGALGSHQLVHFNRVRRANVLRAHKPAETLFLPDGLRQSNLRWFVAADRNCRKIERAQNRSNFPEHILAKPGVPGVVEALRRSYHCPAAPQRLQGLEDCKDRWAESASTLFLSNIVRMLQCWAGMHHTSTVLP